MNCEEWYVVRQCLLLVTCLLACRRVALDHIFCCIVLQIILLCRPVSCCNLKLNAVRDFYLLIQKQQFDWMIDDPKDYKHYCIEGLAFNGGAMIKYK